MRAKAREEYTVPPETTDLMLQADLDHCNKEANDASNGYMIASGVLSGVGVFVWPLLSSGSASASRGPPRTPPQRRSA